MLELVCVADMAAGRLQAAGWLAACSPPLHLPLPQSPLILPFLLLSPPLPLSLFASVSVSASVPLTLALSRAAS
eukprot:1330998-Rhodomonas_salina.1